MSWRASLDSAIRELRKEERFLQRNLDAVRARIDELTGLARSGPGRGRAVAGRPRRNRLSPAGRAAIARAAKRRWAKYRAERRKQKA
jgi:hypothetical protein